jgi:hypothetical protein
MAGGDFMLDFIKIINGLFFDSSDVVIGNFHKYGRSSMVIQMPVTITVDFTVVVFLIIWVFSCKKEIG